MEGSKSMGDKQILKEMGERINSTRKSMKITQEELAEKMDVSVQMISNLELGKKAIRPENMVKLCDSLNISADYILRGKFASYETSEIFEDYNKLSLENQIIIKELIKKLI
nr:helix-turn-helix transcriptional regulator [Oscillospiraceae bacterium]